MSILSDRCGTRPPGATMQVGERKDTEVRHEDQRPPAAVLFDVLGPDYEKDRKSVV